MLPAHLAENIKQQVMFYLQSTFDFSDPLVESAFQRFLEHPENGLFKGPWVQLSRPYRRQIRAKRFRLISMFRFTPSNIKAVRGGDSIATSENLSQPL